VQLPWETLKDLERDYGEAFFLLDLEAFRTNYEEFLDAFRSIYPRSQIAYSYKTNYIPRLCWEVDRLGGYAEVVSGMEYELALRVGVDPERIIFNGPYKSKEELEPALLAGSLVNLDADYEVAVVEGIARRHPQARLNVGLRCNFALEEAHSSRFGFDVDDEGGLYQAFKRLAALDNCVIAGLHCHFSTGQRSVGSYARRTRRLLELSASCFPHHPPRFVNIGGGFFSKMGPELQGQFPCPVPSYQEYAAAIAAEIAAAYPGAAGPELILEPGAALTSDVMWFVAKVVARKRIRDREIALVAGSIHNIKPTLHGKQLPMRVVRTANVSEQPGEAPVVVVGYTCMEHDCLYRGYEGAVRPGDFVVFENVGAYTVVMKPPFIRPAPAILVCDGGDSFAVARRAERFDDLFGGFHFPAQRGPIDSKTTKIYAAMNK
jgi:diaminopimelate decarboxylase